MSKILKRAVPIVACTGFLFLAAPAIGQGQQIVITGKKIPPEYEPVTKIVKIGDLNLATKAGVQQMEKRVEAAVKSLCPTAMPTGAGYEEHDTKLCRDYAWAGARPQMDRAIDTARKQTSGQMR